MTNTIEDDSLQLLEAAGVQGATDFAKVFHDEREKAKELREPTAHKPTVLFVCQQNAGRSQMAQAIFNKKVQELQKDAFAFSAGSVPAKSLNPQVKQVLEEASIDLSKSYPKPVTAEVAAAADVIVTMGCDTSCPYFKGKKTIHWELPDAKGKDVEFLRGVRGTVDNLVDDLIHQLGELDTKKD